MAPRATRGRTARPVWPLQRAAAKRTSGTLIVLLIGDSIGDGIGADPTGDGSDTLAYGGATPPSGCRLFDSNGASFALQATYPDNAGAAPENPGLVPHIHARAIAVGYTGCDVYRYAVSGATTADARGFWQTAWALLLAAGVTPDLLVGVTGTNDAPDSTKSAAMAAALPVLVGAAEWLHGCRVVWVEMIADTAARPEADVVRATTQTVMGARPTRASVPGAGLAAQDTVHPTLATYRTQGIGVVDAYQGVS